MDDEIPKKIKEIEEKTGKNFTKEDKIFALHLAATDNKSEAMRQTGYTGEHARSRGYQMSIKPEIQELVDAVKEYQSIEITKEFIEQGILQTTLEAGAARDKLTGYQLLAKTKGMLKDVVEQTNTNKSDQDMIDEIRREFGEQAATKAAKELGVA